MESRVFSYCHNLNASNSGGALVRLSADTDFATNTDEFKAFGQAVAATVFATGCVSWASLVEAAPHFLEGKASIEGVLRENVSLVDAVVFTTDLQTISA